MRIGVAETPAALVAQSDIIISMLTDELAMQDVYPDERGLLSPEVAGKLFIEMSTVRGRSHRSLAVEATGHGALFVE